MKLLFALLVSFASLFPCLLSAQNLVLNPSFEKKKDLISRRNLEKPIYSAKDWLNPTAGNPKIYGSKRNGYIFDKEGTSWNFRAKSGKHVAALFVYGNNPFNGSLRRDYIQGSLSEPLVIGKKYYFSFWVHYHCEGSDNIGISFLPEWNFRMQSGLLKLEPDAYQKELNNYSRDDSWAIVQDSFIAEHAYKTFIIGNFFSNEDTRVESDKIGHHLAYIDDISVEEAINQDMPGREEPTPLAIVPESDTLLSPKREEFPTETAKAPNPVKVLPRPQPTVQPPSRPEPRTSIHKTYVPINPKKVLLPKPNSFRFEPVFFAYDSPIVRKKYKGQLRRIIQHLKENPQKKILIKGYASEEGGTMYNFSLAMDRAEQTKSFLRRQGIGPERMYIKVIGESVSQEELARGKAYNRRVDFEILE